MTDALATMWRQQADAIEPDIREGEYGARAAVRCLRRCADELDSASAVDVTALREALDWAWKLADDLDSNHGRWVVGRLADRLGIEINLPPVSEPNNRLREQLAEAQAEVDRLRSENALWVPVLGADQGPEQPAPWAKPSGGIFDLRGDAVPEAAGERRPEDDAECERLGCEDRTHHVFHPSSGLSPCWRATLAAAIAAVEPFYSCRCEPAFTGRGRHATECEAETVEAILDTLRELRGEP